MEKMLPEIPHVSFSGRPGNLKKKVISVKNLAKYGYYPKCV